MDKKTYLAKIAVYSKAILKDVEKLLMKSYISKIAGYQYGMKTQEQRIELLKEGKLESLANSEDESITSEGLKEFFGLLKDFTKSE